ncbi:cilia- and flagella-associated protein 251-like [Anthonomus grandis grandis]|uniref:cilia- and flagella-associated protein 251-like n=1 Tax=Anthonomus grandis grandis TaxID=2921223 RepID=UPI002164F85C|nr:cilia- and flagella-associated protein 251-like [Anthonomus grandis grandis]
MSEDSISYGEDKENLLYISRKINVDEFGLGEDGPFRESLSTADSNVSFKAVGSELDVLENITELPRTFSDPQVGRRFRAFNLKWSFGMNGKVGVRNLTLGQRRELFFAAVHSGVIYNYCTREMRHLEGHHDLINCISTDSEGDWLVTSDRATDGCVIIWSSTELTPVFTLFGIYPCSGVLLQAISPCARYLLTIGEKDDSDYYAIHFWDWTLGKETPDGTYLVQKSHGSPVQICFKPGLEEHIMVVFQKQVHFLTWELETQELTLSAIPQLTSKQNIGQLTGGTFMKSVHECYASSSRGCILVFRNTLYSKACYEQEEQSNARIFINAVKVTPSSIGVITTTEEYLVTGDSKGHILFFDKKIRILHWIRNLPIGAITAISFSLSPQKYRFENSKVVIKDRVLDDDKPESLLDCNYTDMEDEITKLVEAPFDATLENNQFTVGDFFISTSDCNIYAHDFIRNTCTPVFQISDANISCIDAHDEEPYIVIGYENGRLALLDFKKKIQISTQLLPKTAESSEGGDTISCIKFSYQSLHLICGRVNGEIYVLEPVTLVPKMEKPFKYSTSRVEKIAFSMNSLQFAYYDEKRTVFLFRYDPENSCWELLGKVRSHYEKINDIAFFPLHVENKKSSVLHTIGADRHLVQYNNLQVTETEPFQATMRERIEQSAIPMNFTYYERVLGVNRSVGYILFADDRHKLKLFNGETKLPRTLSLGPSFGCFRDSLVKKMMILPEHNYRYMIFNSSKYIGIQILPPDGNPFKYTGYLAHPVEVIDFALSQDGLFAFTFGKNDRSVLMWEVKPRAVDLSALMGGTELEPYYCLLEGGKNGWLFQEIQDLFFYMQILQQENIDLPRRVSDSINLTEIPDLVRTCGYYPSHFELETIMIDVRYRDFDETGIVKDEISFVEFVKLFVNHRPAYGYSMEQIKQHFNTVCLLSDYPRKCRIDSNEFIYILQNIGEPSQNLHANLTTLLRVTSKVENNYDFLPPEISTHFLFYELLGIDPNRTESSDYDDCGNTTKDKV